ncbi:MAG TPA: PqqD family protein [Ktedonobacterales bacterium]|nr:PqqD family protein [Ktedonobacterales bacterium]
MLRRIGTWADSPGNFARTFMLRPALTNNTISGEIGISHEEIVSVSQHPMPCRRADIETHLMPDGSCLLYDATTGEAYTLDVVGSFIWEYCDGTLTPDQIAAELAAVLPDSPAIHAEALRVIAEFATAGLVAAANGTAETPDTADTATTGLEGNS